MARFLALLICFVLVLIPQLGVLWVIDWFVETYEIREWLIAFYG